MDAKSWWRWMTITSPPKTTSSVSHLRTGQKWTGPVLREPAQFRNILGEYPMTMEPSRQIFPRGFPFQLRGHKNQPEFLPAPSGATIGVTEGLWLDEPDVDATTWLNGKIKGVRYNGPDLFVLEQATWSPAKTRKTPALSAN